MAEHKVFDVEYDKADINAVKALKAGTANEEQQVRALEFIVHRIAGEPSVTYQPGEDGSRDSAFLEGRRFVGRKIISFALMTNEETDERRSSSSTGSRSHRRQQPRKR